MSEYYRFKLNNKKLHPLKNIFTILAFRITMRKIIRRTDMDPMTIGIYVIGAFIAFYIIKSSIKFAFTIIILGTLAFAVYTYVWPSLQSVLESM